MQAPGEKLLISEEPLDIRLWNKPYAYVMLPGVTYRPSDHGLHLEMLRMMEYVFLRHGIARPASGTNCSETQHDAMNSHLLPFQCSIKPRSAKADSLILNTNELQA